MVAIQMGKEKTSKKVRCKICCKSFEKFITFRQKLQSTWVMDPQPLCP